jgi:hypothetical protein
MGKLIHAHQFWRALPGETVDFSFFESVKIGVPLRVHPKQILLLLPIKSKDFNENSH